MGFWYGLRTATAVLAFGVSAPAWATVYFPDAAFPTDGFNVETQSGGLFGLTGSRAVTINDKTDNIAADAAPSDVRVSAGGFALKATSPNASTVGSFLAWCLDITNYLNLGATPDYKRVDANVGDGDISNNPFSTSKNLTDNQIGNVKRLFDTGYDRVLTAIEGSNSDLRRDLAAGFQVALWKLVFDADENDRTLEEFNGPNKFVNANDDFFVRDTRDAVVNAANSFLAGMSGNRTGNYEVIFLESQHPDEHYGQNLVTVSPVPLPAAGLVLIGALGGLGCAARRQRKARKS